MYGWLIKNKILSMLTNIQKIVQMAHERILPLPAELSCKVIQIKRPHKGSTKLFVLQITDLRIKRKTSERAADKW